MVKHRVAVIPSSSLPWEKTTSLPAIPRITHRVRNTTRAAAACLSRETTLQPVSAARHQPISSPISLWRESSLHCLTLGTLRLQSAACFLFTSPTPPAGLCGCCMACGETEVTTGWLVRRCHASSVAGFLVEMSSLMVWLPSDIQFLFGRFSLCLRFFCGPLWSSRQRQDSMPV